MERIFFCSSSSSVLHTGHEEHCTNPQSYQNHREYFSTMKPATIVVGCRLHSILSSIISHIMLLQDKKYSLKSNRKTPPTSNLHFRSISQIILVYLPYEAEVQRCQQRVAHRVQLSLTYLCTQMHPFLLHCLFICCGASHPIRIHAFL